MGHVELADLHRRRIALAVVATLLFLWTPNTSAGSSERITSFGVDIVVNDDGSTVFTETIQYDFGFNTHHGIERSLLTRVQYDDVNDRRYPLTVISVAAVGVSNQYQVFSDPGGMQRIRIGDPNATVIGKHLFTIKYRLDGVVGASGR